MNMTGPGRGGSWMARLAAFDIAPLLMAASLLFASAFIAGAAVQWLRDGLGIIKESQDVEALATDSL